MKQQSPKEAFHHMLVSPKNANTADIERMIKVFPYSRALWFVKAKAEMSFPELFPEQGALAIASLMAGDSDKLYQYLYLEEQSLMEELDEVKEDTVLETNDILFQEDEAPPIAKEEEEPAAIAATAEDDTLLVESDEETTGQDEAYFSVPEGEGEMPGPIGPEEDSAQPEEEKTVDGEKEEISKYDDDLMPYSFLWWLHKTRIAYAETYRPYASDKPLLSKSSKQEAEKDPYLDQQIKEHIFHLQSPEAKLNLKEGDKQSTIFHVPSKANDIIDRFIKEEPQISPPKPDKITLENKARKSAEDQSAFVSETLATIYIEQGLYHKAVDTYMKLSLKYPEKSAYFADRIQELKKKTN